MRRRLPVAVALLVAMNGAGLHAQNTQDFFDWLNRRLQMATAPVMGAATPGKQVETLSIADNSTALVDRAGAPDLIGLALQFLNLGTDRDGAPASVTFSAFTLRTAVLGLDPNKPEVYAGGRNWRRLSGSVGREAADAVIGTPETQLIGVKVLAWDGRDPTRPENVAALQAALKGSMQVAQAMQVLIDEVGRRLAARALNKSRESVTEDELQTFLENQLGAKQHAATLQALTDEDLAAIDALLVERLAPVLRTQRDESLRSIKALTRAPQLAFSYQAKLRDQDSGGADEHALQAILDYSVFNRMSVSVNAALSRVARPLVDATVGGRVGVEAQFQLTGGRSNVADLLRTSSPLMVSASYAGMWDGADEDTHRFQTKLTIPLPALLSGLSLPVSVTVATRPELIDETEIRGQVGFTVDFSRFQQALRAVAR